MEANLESSMASGAHGMAVDVPHEGVSPIPLQAEASRLLEDIRCALATDTICATAIAEHLVSVLANRRALSACTRLRGGLAPWQQRRIEAFIDDKLDSTIQTKDLAVLVSLSYSHFARAFKDSFGWPPHGYVLRKRVERAKTLIRTSSESLAQIALLCGFADQAHFCRRFRRQVGVTPAVWRRHLA